MEDTKTRQAAPAGPVLTTTQVAERWGLARNTISVMWRQGRMPKPFNADMAKGHRWSLAVIEEFEQTGQVAS